MLFAYDFVPQAVKILYITGDNEDLGEVGSGGAAAAMAKRLATLYKYLAMAQMVNGGSSVTALEKVGSGFNILL